jgi:crotonobetainyl-CoA:carnitine CoA-transferase CaiB-like acyl-CoA transferase
MQLGYRDLAAQFPRLIYVSISGFGHTGPRRKEAGYDAVAQAEGGLMSVTGAPDGPAVRLGVAIADLASGMNAFQGMLLALIARATTGRGQHVDIGLLDSVASLLTYQAQRYFATGEPPVRTGNRHSAIAPYETFDALDGVLVLAIGNDDQWQKFCAVAGLERLQGDGRFTTNADRVRHYADLRPIVSQTISERSLDEWMDRLRGARVPCGAVRSVAEALADPQILAREMVQTIAHPTIGPLKTLGIPIKLSDTPGAIRSAPPRLGEHTRLVLERELDVSSEEITRLERAGTIRCVTS